MKIDPALHAALVSVVDERVNQILKSRTYTAYGLITAVDTIEETVSVAISGDSNPSDGFKYPDWQTPKVDQKVRVVIDPQGDRYVDQLYDVPAVINTDVIYPLEGIDLRDGNAPGTDYPAGMSLTRVTDQAAVGWPLADGRGTVLTISNGLGTSIHQLWMRRGSVGNQWYARNWDNGALVWRAWVQVI